MIYSLTRAMASGWDLGCPLDIVSCKGCQKLNNCKYGKGIVVNMVDKTTFYRECAEKIKERGRRK